MIFSGAGAPSGSCKERFLAQTARHHKLGMQTMETGNLGYTPAMYGYGMPMQPPRGASMLAADGTLSLASVSEAVKRVLQGQAQQINQLQQQAGAESGQGAGGMQGGQNRVIVLPGGGDGAQVARGSSHERVTFRCSRCIRAGGGSGGASRAIRGPR